MRTAWLLAAAVVVSTAGGCSLSKKNAGNGGEAEPEVSQAEFQRMKQRLAEERRASDRAVAEEPAALPSMSAQSPPPRVGTPRRVDGMVGQVNGQAIYADAIFEPIEPTLRTLGRRLPQAEFRTRATQIIGNRLGELITNSVVYGAAERDLTENEQAGLRLMVDRHRDELIRKYGQGSVTLANDTLVEEEDATLAETVEAFRQEVVIRRYISREVAPLVNVSRRDVRRYYEANIDEFVPPQTYAVSFIRNGSEDVVRGLWALIDTRSLTFDEAAGDKDANDFRPDQAGLFAEGLRLEDIGEGVLRDTAATLGDGEVSEPFEFNGLWWVMRLDHEERPEAQTLTEAQVEIDRLLRSRSGQVEQAKFIGGLQRNASHTPTAQMTGDLVEIAIARYSRPTPGGDASGG
ncbi:MAG: peptidylprolyl isomerase [Planctomycetota bacterium]